MLVLLALGSAFAADALDPGVFAPIWVPVAGSNATMGRGAGRIPWPPAHTRRGARRLIDDAGADLGQVADIDVVPLTDLASLRCELVAWDLSVEVVREGPWREGWVEELPERATCTLAGRTLEVRLGALPHAEGVVLEVGPQRPGEVWLGLHEPLRPQAARRIPGTRVTCEVRPWSAGSMLIIRAPAGTWTGHTACPLRRRDGSSLEVPVELRVHDGTLFPWCFMHRPELPRTADIHAGLRDCAVAGDHVPPWLVR